MSESQEYQPKSEYYKLIPNDGNVVADFIEKFLAQFPEAKIKIEKFLKDSITRENSDADVDTFIKECRKSKPLGSSVKAEREGFPRQDVLQFATTGVDINGEDHIIWVYVPDTDENREKVDRLL